MREEAQEASDNQGRMSRLAYCAVLCFDLLILKNTVTPMQMSCFLAVKYDVQRRLVVHELVPRSI